MIYVRTETNDKEVINMENKDRTVIGTFMERDEAVSEIQRLHNLGYSKAEINVYSSPERAQDVERLMAIDVEGAEVVEDEAVEDTSWWDTIKHSFNLHAFHSEDGHHYERIIEGEKREDDRSASTEVSDETLELLEPYREDLANGKLVIMVDNYGKH